MIPQASHTGDTEAQLDELNTAFEAQDSDAYHNEEWPEEGRKELCEAILDAYDNRIAFKVSGLELPTGTPSVYNLFRA